MLWFQIHFTNMEDSFLQSSTRRALRFQHCSTFRDFVVRYHSSSYLRNWVRCETMLTSCASSLFKSERSHSASRSMTVVPFQGITSPRSKHPESIRQHCPKEISDHCRIQQTILSWETSAEISVLHRVRATSASLKVVLRVRTRTIALKASWLRSTTEVHTDTTAYRLFTYILYSISPKSHHHCIHQVAISRHPPAMLHLVL